jgi:xanthine phosphoribosyltransferase
MSDIIKTFYSFDEYKDDVNALSSSLNDHSFDAIVCIARGGLFLGASLSEKLNIRNVQSINAILYDDTVKGESISIKNLPNLENCDNVLVVDELVDSGTTFSETLKILSHENPNVKFTSSVIFQNNKSSFVADFYLKPLENWVVFFWEQDTLD